ncbi:hypothetical protein HU200_059936 [Digitaria exilis]|uniref:Uncharacterized protein n=1 Tax=Digitaria exilis TaxID=1010633 RepID=A0A835AB15_9POAL|nr:hypothetical protein HU200_059936 [Digitaria exilis]
MIIEARRQFGAKILRELIIVACWSIWTHRNEKHIFREEFGLVIHKAEPSLKMEL